MSTRSYERLSIEAFGDHLLRTGDLDPLYIGLYKAPWPREQLERFLVAYWSFYHVGAACWLSEKEGLEFWHYMNVAAYNEHPAPIGKTARWPRGSERRHFRGAQASDGVGYMRNRYHQYPERMVRYIATGDEQGTYGEETIGFETCAARAREHRGFGPWIAFKICDMLDSLGLTGVNFEQAHVFMFDDPAKAAELLYRERAGLPEAAKIKRDKVIPVVVNMLTKHFEKYDAQPLGVRPVALQEIETILCKYKSHVNGHYPLNNDIHEINKGLAEWATVTESAKSLLAVMPDGRDLR